ncbi:MAG: hypothetical protein KDC24_14815, partial [Saprospiraceae bacterium]|nr:hypothetical protein [Saprospiraceae bacterium]
MSHLQLLLFILLITGCATAQEDVIYFSKTGMTEKDSVAYFFHGDDGSVGSSGWFDYNGGKKETMSPSGQHVTLLRRAKLADGSKGGLEIMTWRNLSGGSEVEFPEFSEKAYQAPIEVQYTFGNCEGISEAVYCGNMNERLGVKMNDNGNLSIGSKVSPADKGVLFLKEGNPAEWKYLKTHPNAGAGGMIDCKLLETGV